MFSAYFLYMMLMYDNRKVEANHILEAASQDKQLQKAHDTVIGDNKATAAILGTDYSVIYKKEIVLNSRNFRLDVTTHSGSISYQGISVVGAQGQTSVGYSWALK